MSEVTQPVVSTILVETIGRVGVIRLNRPGALNALNLQTMNEVVAALGAFDEDTAIGCIVLTGSERAFAAGADIKEMAHQSYMDMHLSNWFAGWDAVGRVSEFVQHDEVHPAEIFSHPPLATRPPFGFKLVDQFDDVEEPAALAVTDQGACQCNGKVRLASAGAAHQYDVALVCEEVSGCQVIHQGLVDRRVLKLEFADILGERQLGNSNLISD